MEGGSPSPIKTARPTPAPTCLWAPTASVAGSTASFGALTRVSKLGLAEALSAAERFKTAPYHSLGAARTWLRPTMTGSLGSAELAPLVLGLFLLKPLRRSGV